MGLVSTHLSDLPHYNLSYLGGQHSIGNCQCFGQYFHLWARGEETNSLINERPLHTINQRPLSFIKQQLSKWLNRNFDKWILSSNFRLFPYIRLWSSFQMCNTWSIIHFHSSNPLMVGFLERCQNNNSITVREMMGW